MVFYTWWSRQITWSEYKQKTKHDILPWDENIFSIIFEKNYYSWKKYQNIELIYNPENQLWEN